MLEKVIANNIIDQLTSPNGFNGDIQGLKPSPFSYQSIKTKKYKREIEWKFYTKSIIYNFSTTKESC